jgi:hypothetical protein
MNQYTDLNVIECNRLHSEEAKSGNNTNYALWTTNLTDIVHLDAGDKVSVHGAMISERGAGQSSSIEIKGVNTGIKKTFNYTVIDNGNASTHLQSGYDRISCNASSQEVNIRDDTLNFNLEYYKPANAKNYIHMPRRFWYNGALSKDGQWTTSDNIANGMSNYFFLVEEDPFSFNQEYYALDDGFNPSDGGTRYFKPRNDNNRYTIMMRDNTYYTQANASGNLGGFINSSSGTYNASLGKSRDPENATYRVYREFKSISLDAGFNSPEYISSEITRQLREIKKETIHKYGYVSASTPADRKEQPIPFYRTIETETYKPFNVANTFRSIHAHATKTTDYYKIEHAFNEYMNTSGANLSSDNASGYDYLSQYHVIGCKRPEIYETGIKINKLYAGDSDPNRENGIFGSYLEYNWQTADEDLILRQKYTKENVENLKAFFDAQSKYPEIWNYFKDTDNEYNDGDTINNSRWIHINRFNNASMTYTGHNNDAMLGDSYYSTRSGSMADRRVHSVLLPIYYDNNEEFNQYYDIIPTKENVEWSYGIIGHNYEGYIKLRPTAFNGYGSTLYDEIKEELSGFVESSRKIGFDLHFTAPAMKYILPYAGYSPVLSSYQSTNVGDYSLVPMDWWAQNIGLDGSVFINKLYIGAVTPELIFDGTNFGFSGLHTALNVPNDNRVGNQHLTDTPTAETEAGSIIYEINPKEYLNDWTPDRKPYFVNPVVSGSGSSAVSVEKLNLNLEPWAIYDSLCGVFMRDFNLTEQEWTGTLWDLLGFTYSQFNSQTNNRLIKTDSSNVDSLSLITTNAEVDRADSKVYVQNSWATPLYNNMMPNIAHIYEKAETSTLANYYPNIQLKTQSLVISAEKLPTRMIRGYYTIRSNILQQAQFIGGKKNNTQMPIISIVDKINGDGDFYFQQESSLAFTVTKPIRLASITCSVHDPDGSYSRVSEQSTVLFKIERTKNVTFNVVQELLQENSK